MVSFDSVLYPLVVLILGMSVGQSGGSRIGKCKYQFHENGTVIDLNPLASHDGSKWKFSVSGSEPGSQSQFNYMFSPCWPMDHLPSEQEACHDAVACQEDIQHTLYYDLGNFSTEQFKMDGASVVLSYSGVTGGKTRTSQITLVCDKAASDATFTFDEQTDLTYKFTLTAKECCPISIGGLSFGSILCIIFVVVLVVYLVAGVLINKFARGATGAELIPTRAFWADLPSLIKEGFQFTVAKISGCFSRDSQYDQI